MFDRDRSGSIDQHDLHQVALSLGRDPATVQETVMNFDPNHDGKLTFPEFLSVMHALQGGDSTRRDLGPLRPARGVVFVPDAKVLDFLMYDVLPFNVTLI